MKKCRFVGVGINTFMIKYGAKVGEKSLPFETWGETIIN
jgi:hypothetical protein